MIALSPNLHPLPTTWALVMRFGVIGWGWRDDYLSSTHATFPHCSWQHKPFIKKGIRHLSSLCIDLCSLWESRETHHKGGRKTTGGPIRLVWANKFSFLSAPEEYHANLVSWVKAHFESTVCLLTCPDPETITRVYCMHYNHPKYHFFKCVLAFRFQQKWFGADENGLLEKVEWILQMSFSS